LTHNPILGNRYAINSWNNHSPNSILCCFLFITTTFLFFNFSILFPSIIFICLSLSSSNASLYRSIMNRPYAIKLYNSIGKNSSASLQTCSKTSKSRSVERIEALNLSRSYWNFYSSSLSSGVVGGSKVSRGITFLNW